MKTKLVLWGKNAQEQRVLTAIELKPEANLVGTYVFAEEIATDDFANQLMQVWRDGKELEFPEGYNYSEMPLSITENILPEGLTLERPDLLSRAQTEWHFVVLSSKLHDVYRGELEDLADKIQKLEKYDGATWEQLKGYWNKVRGQIKDQNLFREHADSLQSGVNAQFDALKKLKAKQEEAFQATSSKTKEKFMGRLEEIDAKIEEGKRLSSVFDELKTLQRKFREARFTREDKGMVWQKLDGAFKKVKEKRFGPDANKDNSAMSRFDRRLDGLMKAMDRMNKSIQRDMDDLEFQKRKIARTDGQLEAQIRQAKIVMIEGRMKSKQERLEDMKKTQAQIEKQIEKQKERDARRAEKQRIEEAKKAAAAKLDAQIQAEAAARAEEAAKLEKAAEAIIEQKGGTSPTTETAQVVENVSESIKDTASTVAEKVEDTVAEVTEQVAASTEQTVENVVAGVENTAANVVETVKETAEQAVEKVTATADTVKESVTTTAAEVAETVETKTDQVANVVTSEASAIKEEAENAAAQKIEEELEKAEEVRKEAAEKTAETLAQMTTAVEATTDAVEEKAKDVSDAITEGVETAKSIVEEKD